MDPHSMWVTEVCPVVPLHPSTGFGRRGQGLDEDKKD